MLGFHPLKSNFSMIRTTWLILMFVLMSNAQDSTDVEQTTVVELCSNGTEESCEAFNVSETSTVMGIDATQVPTVSSKKPKTTTSKSVVKKTTLMTNMTSPTQPHMDCSCDTTRGGCEVNCCCDVDCTAEQRSVFTHCAVVQQIVDLDQCFPSQLIYRNNTDFQTVQTDPGVLCVLHQNTLSSTDYTDVPVVRTLSALKNKLGRQQYYSWPNPQPATPVFEADTMYDNESPVWITDNSSITYLDLPTSLGVSSLCKDKTVPKYLQNMETSCAVYLRDQNECASLEIDQFVVISSPKNFNFTQPQDCTEDVCLPIIYHTCSKNCSEGKISPPFYNRTLNMCQNIVHSIEYKIYHNGSQGIVEVKAFAHLKNLTVTKNQLFRRHFKVTFEWAVAPELPSFERSGRPGYEYDKPIISGRKVLKSFEYNFTKSDWISVSIAGMSGYCEKRYNLMFGENLRSQCFLNISGTCDVVQNKIWKQMLGPVANLSESVISSYGDPRADDREAWVPLLASDPAPAPHLVTSMEILIIYSLVGQVSSPQAKIVAAYLHHQPPTYKCDKHLSTVLLETSVRFIDKTTPAVTKFAQPPVYEIKLPRDFFYPFLSDGCVKNEIQNRIMFLIVFLNFIT